MQIATRVLKSIRLCSLCFGMMETRHGGDPQLMMVIKQDKSDGLYGDIKRMSDTVLGIPSQCVLLSNIRQANPHICANLCLKMNMKLGGRNAVLRDSLPLVTTASTIFIGAAFENRGSCMSSQAPVFAVVASMDRHAAKYIARVAVEKDSLDIQQLSGMLRELFLAYYKHTKCKPNHVIYYRTGVSGEEQMHDSLQTEMRALRMAFKMISGQYKPLVTFLVANKRHHLRAFPVNSCDADGNGNVKPGTVIDTDVTGPHGFDFYLYGHKSVLGTSVPCHYTVLYDENKFTADEIQRRTYYLGHTFARSNRSTSLVPPVRYARLAASRARLFLTETMHNDSTTDNNEGSSTVHNVELAELHSNLKDCMFFI